MDLFADIWQFIKSVGSQWGWLMAGIGALGIGIWERFRKKPILPINFLVIASIFIFVATFLAWRDEHNKFKPEIRSAIDGIYIATKTDFPEILIIANIKNLGDPTGIEGWRLDIKFPDGKQITANNFRIFLTNISMELPTGVIKLDKKDALYNKAINPINKGAIVRGFMVFIMPDFKRESIKLTGTQIKLSFEDIVHQIHSATVTVSPQTFEPSYFPGLSWPED